MHLPDSTHIGHDNARPDKGSALFFARREISDDPPSAHQPRDDAEGISCTMRNASLSIFYSVVCASRLSASYRSISFRLAQSRAVRFGNYNSH